jgi:hypothetical protein
MKKIYLLLFLSFLFLSACKKTDNTPSWLVINDFVLTTDEPTEGDNSHGISDVWVYMDNQAIGIFEIPCRIPILAEGPHDFTIYAGVKQNGISSTRVRYPFYDRYDASITLIKDQDVVATPTTKYKSAVQFSMIEDFENIGVDFVRELISDTDIVVLDKVSYPSIVEYGNNCGAIFLTLADSIYKGATSADLNLPGSGADVYVEMDFMNDNSMLLSLKAENSTSTNEAPLVQMNPQDPSTMKWKKIYISLKDNVSFEIFATSFEIILTSIIDAEKTSGVVYLDNIKVLHF